MKKRYLLMSIAALLGSALPAGAQDYKLEQVVIMSRHNLRAPLITNDDILAKAAAKAWPQWDTKGSELTTKGGALEVYMAHYMSTWLRQTGLLPKDGCPAKGSVDIYANSLQRTVATAQFFAAGAFPSCDIAVRHQDKMGTMDPTFNPSITDPDSAFNKQALADMNAKLASLKLAAAYKRLENVIGYKASTLCKQEKACDLAAGKNELTANMGKEPGTVGSLRMGNSMVDAFQLQYYEGFPKDQVAWGRIRSEQDWQQLAELKNAYQDTLFTTPSIAKNVAKPLVLYLDKTLSGVMKTDAPKMTVLIGHDSNIASLFAALRMKPYKLPHQFEKTPIGGKVAFERWHDAAGNRDLLKIEYIYQSTEQLRSAAPLNTKNPPYRVTLSLEGCPTDANGFCAWSDFEKVLKAAQ